MKKQTDLAGYGNEELSFYFLNEEPLYKVLVNSRTFKEVKDVADFYFEYTESQLKDLEETWKLEQNEQEK